VVVHQEVDSVIEVVEVVDLVIEAAQEASVIEAAVVVVEVSVIEAVVVVVIEEEAEVVPEVEEEVSELELRLSSSLMKDSRVFSFSVEKTMLFAPKTSPQANPYTTKSELALRRKKLALRPSIESGTHSDLRSPLPFLVVLIIST